VLPAGLQDLCASSAESVGVPVDFPASHALAVASGAIGASFDLQVKRGYMAPSNLWVCVIAPPGSGKSPSVRPILEPVFREQRRRNKSEDQKKKPAYVSDVTIEKLAVFLGDNPRGLLMVWDEMSGWLTSFNQYKAKGAGNDRAHYLSIWDGRALKIDRKGPDSPPVFVPHPRLSVVGGIQPEVLDTLRAGPSDGLFDRMLFAYPSDPGLPIESFAEVDDAPCEAWERALRTLWDRKMHEPPDDQDKRPNVVHLNEDARPMWQGWTRELAEKAASLDAPPYFRAIAAKISGYAARLALVLHLLREAYGENPGYGVGCEDLLRAVSLSMYFLDHADRVHRSAGRDPRLNAAKAIQAWLVKRGQPAFSKADAWSSLRNNSLFTRPEDLDKPIDVLRQHRSIRGVAEERGGRNGRPPGESYEVNPKLVGTPASGGT